MRRKLLAGKPDWLKVLDTAAEKGDWGKPLPAGSGRGIAICTDTDSLCAQVAEVTVTPSGEVKVNRVTVALDTRYMVNPQTIAEQAEGSVIFGLTAALYGKITIKDGAAVQGNFDTYRMVRLAQAPKIDVHLMPSGGKVWGGAGEPATPPIAAAVANAIFAATGKRIRSLPIMRSRPGRSGIADACQIDIMRRRHETASAHARTLRGVTPAEEARDVTTISRMAFCGLLVLFAAQRRRCAGGREYQPARQPGRISGARRRLRRLPLGARRQGVCRRTQDGHRRSATSTRPTSRPIQRPASAATVLPDFDRALRQGIAKDGHRLYPAMPYPSYAKLTDADVARALRFLHEAGAAGPSGEPSERDSVISRLSLAAGDLERAVHR